MDLYYNKYLKYKYLYRNLKGGEYDNFLVYYINLNKRPDRKQIFIDSISKTIFKNSYIRFPAIDGNTINLKKYASITPMNLEKRRGKLGCAESHISLWRICLKQQKPIIIFEDDTIFKPIYNQNIKLALSHLPKIYDIIYFHVNSRAKHVPEQKYFHRIKSGNWSTTNYMVSPRGAKKLLDYMTPYNPKKEVDGHISTMTFRKLLDTFIFMLPTVYTIQDFNESDVHSSKDLIKIHDFHRKLGK